MKKIFIILFAILFSQTAQAGETKKAIFAGGCFWSTQKAFDHVNGVVSTRAGYYGGHLKNPSYSDVTSETSGHVEAVEVVYDPTKVTYQKLLNAFWVHTDPTNPNGVICDFAPSYQTAIFTFDEDQNKIAIASRLEIAGYLKKKIYTKIIPVSSVKLPFYAAEDYHQHYWKTHAWGYGSYYTGCGREGFLKKLWGARFEK